MKISSINYQNQHTSKAVNEKFLKKAIDKYNRCAPNHDQGHLLEVIGDQACYGGISKQDAIDTLEAIKPYAQNAIKYINSMIEDMKKWKD